MKNKKGDVIELLKFAIIRANRLTKREKQINEQIADEKDKCAAEISEYMSSLELTEYEFSVDGDELLSVPTRIYTCKRVEPKQIVYDAVKVSKAVGKINSKALIIKTYKINDMQGLVALLKKHCVSPKEFKKYIDVDMAVDEQKLDSLYQTGLVTIEDLKGCYEVRRRKPYWSIKEKVSKD